MSCCGGNQSQNNNSFDAKIRKFVSKLPIIFSVLILLGLVYYFIF